MQPDRRAELSHGDGAADAHDDAPPKRRYRLTLDLHADTWDDLADALHNIATQVLIEHHRDVTSGGYSSGYRLSVIEDPTMSHDAYIAALDAWRDRHA